MSLVCKWPHQNVFVVGGVGDGVFVFGEVERVVSVGDDAVATASVGVGFVVNESLVVIGVAGVVGLAFLGDVGAAAVVDDRAGAVVVALADALRQLDEVFEKSGIGETVFR